MIERDIWLAIRARIESLPVVPPMPIAWPAEKFQVPAANGRPAPFIRVGNVTATPNRMMIDTKRPYRRTGTVIITLVYPLGQVVSVYDQIAGTIAEHFGDGTCMSFGIARVTVPSDPHVQSGYEDNAYWNVPVAVPWTCYG